MVALMEWTDGISRNPDGRTCFLNQGCHHVFFSGPSQGMTVSLTAMLTLELKDPGRVHGFPNNSSDHGNC